MKEAWRCQGSLAIIIYLFEINIWNLLTKMMKLSETQTASVKKFNENLARNNLKIESVECLCKSTNSSKIASFDHYGLWSPTVICKNCGLIFANPRLTMDSYRIFYTSDEYRQIYEGALYIDNAKRRFADFYGKHIFDELYPFIRGKNGLEIMEFGCGAGWNLNHFYIKGYPVTGYDYSPSLVEVGKLRGLNLTVGSTEKITGTYDVIVLSHVIEHFTDFFGEMKSILSHLKNGGIVYIEVPDMDNISGQLQNAHVYYFTIRTLNHFLAKLGLRVIKSGVAQTTHMYGIYELDQLPLTKQIDLSKEYKTMLRKAMFSKLKDFIRNLYNFLLMRT